MAIPSKSELRKETRSEMVKLKTVEYPPIDSFFGFNALESVEAYLDHGEVFNPYGVSGGPEEYKRVATEMKVSELVEIINESIEDNKFTLEEDFIDKANDFVFKLMNYVDRNDVTSMKSDLSEIGFGETTKKLTDKKDIFLALRDDYLDIYVVTNGDISFDKSLMKLQSLVA